MKKVVAIIFCVFLVFLFGCSEVDPEQTENYRLGYEAGYDAAWTEHRDDYDHGYETGYEDGVSAASWDREDIQDLLDEAREEGYSIGYEDAWYDMEHGNPNLMETDPGDFHLEGPIPSDIGG